MSSLNPKRTLLAGLADIAKALGHAHRLTIVELLAQGERSVEALAERAGLSVANASQHLRLMRRAGVLVSRRDGKRILYRPSDPSVLVLTGALRRVAERNAAEVRAIVDGYFRQRDALEPVSRRELARRLTDGTVTVLDVRPADEFAAGHLPKAMSIPLGELQRRLREIPKNRAVVAYCRGPCCVLAYEAVALVARPRLQSQAPRGRLSGMAGCGPAG